MPARFDVEFGGLNVRANTVLCSECGRHLRDDSVEFATTYKPVRPFPLSIAADGYYCASRNFVAFALDVGLTGFEFVPLENEYSVLNVARCVRYDLPRMEYLVERNWCSSCETYESHLVYGPRPIAKDQRPIGPLEIVESCDRWGEEVNLTGKGSNAQHPDLIAGDLARKLIEEQGFRGIAFTETV